MMLGDILARLSDETAAVETILGSGDLTLLAAAKERAASDGLDLGACVTQTVQRYTHEASRRGMGHADGDAQSFGQSRRDCLKRAFEHAQRG